MRRMFWSGAAAVLAVGLMLFGIRMERAVSTGEPLEGMTAAYVRGLPGPVTAVLASGHAGVTFAGAAGGVYRSADGGRTWKRVLRAGIGKGPVRELVSDPAGRSVYAVSGDALYLCSGENGRWERVLTGPGEVLCIAVNPKAAAVLLAGLAGGVRVSRDGGKSWEEPLEGRPAGPVRQALFDPVRQGTCYAVSDAGLYRSPDAGKSWSRLRLISRPEEEGSMEQEEEELPVPEEAALCRLAADGAGNLYFSTGRGVFLSADAGTTWGPIPTVGMGTPPVSHLLPGPSQAGGLYAATSDGVFAYSAEWKAWRPVAELAAQGAGSMGLDAEERLLWVATRRGLLRLPAAGIDAPHDAREGSRLLSSAGPPIAAVHAAAVRYAEVHPGKISRWRTLARLRSLVPSFTLGLDRDRDTNIVSSTAQGVTRFTAGPERETLSLDFGFTWDLADLLWSTDQTAIDVRSRLMVQLRQEVLEETTRLYFERKRLLAEFAGHPSDDPLLDGERDLRVEELTAQLDALTGGWFSEND